MSRRLGMGTVSPAEQHFALQLKECGGNVGQAQQLLASKMGNKLQIPLSLRNEITWELGIQDTAGADNVASYWSQSKINLLNDQTPDTAIGQLNVSNDFASGAQLGCDFLMFGIGFELVGENMSFTLQGNGINTSGAVFASPDDFLVSDTAGELETGITPAVFDFGGCTQRAAEAISDGYALTMLVQQTFPLIGGGPHARPLSDFASCGNPSAYADGMSSSDVDSSFWVNKVNDHYNSLPAGNPFGRRFVPTNVSRQGETLASVTAAARSAWSPDSSSNLVKATWGTQNRHPIYTNECWKPFLTPVLIKQGAPFQVYMEEYDQAWADRARAHMGTTFGQAQTIDATGVATPVGFSATDGGVAGPFTEVNTGSAVDVTGLSVDARCIVYKYGLLRMRVCFYGYQIVDSDVSSLLMGVSGRPAPGVSGIDQGTEQSLIVLGPNS